MSFMMSCGICCMLTSIWAVIQLAFMGIFYYIEALVLLEDCEAEEYDDYDDFISKTKENYHKTAINCWIAAAMYAITLGLSYTCIVKARSKAKKEAVLHADDEYVCLPKKEEKKKKKAEKVEKFEPEKKK